MTEKNASIYVHAPSGSLVSPFNLKLMPMQRMLLIGFEKDPDEIYAGLEPQMFDDAVNGRGLRVIAWRRDGHVDVYQQPGLKLEDNFDVAGKGLADLVVKPMDGAQFEISEAGVDVHFSFQDNLGRPIEVTIKEQGLLPTRPFPLLAPVGFGSETPSALPLFFLYDFYFVRQTGTEVSIKLNGTEHRPDPFPMPLDGAKCYFMRYSSDPFMVSWNDAMEGPLHALCPEGDTSIAADGVRYDLVNNQGYYEIARMGVGDDRHEASIAFSPPVPDIAALGEGVKMNGTFRVVSDESAGSISGVYQVNRTAEGAEISVHPSGGWKHNTKRLLLRFIFLVGSAFRVWPKTYRWNAKITFLEEGATIQSGWTRVTKGS